MAIFKFSNLQKEIYHTAGKENKLHKTKAIDVLVSSDTYCKEDINWQEMQKVNICAGHISDSNALEEFFPRKWCRAGLEYYARLASEIMPGWKLLLGWAGQLSRAGLEDNARLDWKLCWAAGDKLWINFWSQTQLDTFCIQNENMEIWKREIVKTISN